MASLLPQQIPPPATPLIDKNGMMEQNWWLFFYHLAQEVLGNQNVTPATLAAQLLADNETDAQSIDALPLFRRVANLESQQGIEPEQYASIAAVQEALQYAQTALLQDPTAAGASTAFSSLTSGNNTTATMEVGSGASLSCVDNALSIISGGGGLTSLSTRNVGAGDRSVYFPATDSNLMGYTGAGTFIVSGLPAASANQDQWAIVTDATAPTYGGALTGGGAVRCPVYSDGTSWTSR